MATQAARSAATTKALRRAARRLFARRGFDSVSVDDIAAAAGVTRGALYHHYPSKEDLFEVVLRDVEQILVDTVRQAAAAHTDPLEQLRAGTDAFIDAASNRQYSRIPLIDGPAVLGPARYRAIDEAFFLGLVRSSIDHLRPDISAAQNALAARAISAAVCELATHASHHPDERETVKSVAKDIVTALVPPTMRTQ